MDPLTNLAEKTNSAILINEHWEEFSDSNEDTQSKADSKLVIYLRSEEDVSLTDPENKWYMIQKDAEGMLQYTELFLINNFVIEKTVPTDELLKHEFQVLAQRIDKLEKDIIDRKHKDNKPIMKQMIDERVTKLFPKLLKNTLRKSGTANNKEYLSEIVKNAVLTAIDHLTTEDNLVQENKETQGNMTTECVAKSYSEKSVSPEEKQPLSKAEVKARVDEQVEGNTGAKKKDAMTREKKKNDTKLKNQGNSSCPLEEQRTSRGHTYFNRDYVERLINTPDLPNNRNPEDCQRYYEHRQNAVNLLVFKKSEFSLHLNDRKGLIQPTFNYYTRHNRNTSAKEQ